MVKFGTRPNCILNMAHQINRFDNFLPYDEQHKYKYEEVIYLAICLLQ